MILYLLRHAHAESDENIPDERRELTEEGRVNAQAVANMFRRQPLNIHTLYTSPRIRAIQTAEIVSPVLGVMPTINSLLDFNFSIGALSELLRDIPPYGDVMLVGHEPTFSECIRALTGASIQMKKCGLARVDLMTTRAPYRGDLLWLVPPKIVRGLSLEDED
jgi:phosphohistidine phosphatase